MKWVSNVCYTHVMDKDIDAVKSPLDLL